MKSEELGSLIVRPDVTIAEALTVLDATGVGMILVCDELRHLLGVLTDGDVAAMVVASAVGRLLPGVIRLESLEEESHWNLILKKERHMYAA